MTEPSKIVLSGSERTLPADATLVGPTDPNELVDVSIVVKQRRELKLDHLQGKILSHDEFASAYGADPENIERVRAFAIANNLTVVEHDNQVACRTLKVRGTVANLEKAFSVTLNDYDHPTGRFRGRSGAIHLPANLADVVQGVFGLDNRSQAKPHYRLRGVRKLRDQAPAAASNTSY